MLRYIGVPFDLRLVVERCVDQLALTIFVEDCVVAVHMCLVYGVTS